MVTIRPKTAGVAPELALDMVPTKAPPSRGDRDPNSSAHALIDLPLESVERLLGDATAHPAQAVVSSSPAMPASPLWQAQAAFGEGSPEPGPTAHASEQASTASEPSPSQPVLAEFGKYEILGRLATGGMAEIYLGRESAEGWQRHIVVKVLRQHLLDDPEFESMLRREGRVAMQLSHPNICTTYEFGVWRGHYFIAMEYVEGATLRQILDRLALRGESMPPEVVLYVLSEVAAALHYAHSARDAQRRRLGVVHRDVSPQNVMVRFDGVVKLLDFGVAKIRQCEDDETRSDAVKGKFGYLAPEQCVAGPVDARTDIFALGIVLHESLTGRRLFRRDSQYHTFEAILEGDIPSLASSLPEHGEALDALVRRALAREPGERFQSAAEMQQALEELLAAMGQGVGARRLQDLIRPLFWSELIGGPELCQDETVARRLTPKVSAEPPAATFGDEPSDITLPGPSWLVRGLVAGVAVLTLLVGYLLLRAPDVEEVPAQPRASAAGSPESERAPSPTEASAETPAPSEEAPAAAIAEVSESEAALPPEPPSMSTPPGEPRPVRRTPGSLPERGTMRPGFVATPGF